MKLLVVILVWISVIDKGQSDEYSELPFDRLMGKFNIILSNIKSNNGVISDEDKDALEKLKEDITEDCKAGKLHEYTGDKKYVFHTYDSIKTKVYHVRLANNNKDVYYWVLPEVDCNGLDGRVNYESDDELDDEYESDSEGDDESDSETDQGGQRKRVKPALGTNDQFTSFIKEQHRKFDKQNERDKVTLESVPKPPKKRVHVQ